LSLCHWPMFWCFCVFHPSICCNVSALQRERESAHIAPRAQFENKMLRIFRVCRNSHNKVFHNFFSFSSVLLKWLNHKGWEGHAL
jgi:hypothetical protein